MRLLGAILNRFYFLFFFSILLAPLGLRAQNPHTHTDNNEILIISSSNSDAQFMYNYINVFIDEYKRLGGKYSPIVESMNCTSLTSAGKWKETLKNILDKHPNPRLIILLGGEAWYSYFSLKESIYKEIPVICANYQQYGAEIPDNGKTTDFIHLMKQFNIIACFSYRYDIKKNIELIESLYPDVKNIAVLTDNTYRGVSLLRIIEKELAEHPELRMIPIDGRFEETPSARGILKGLPENTVLLVGSWRIDKEDVVYTNNAVYTFGNINPSLPVFSLTPAAIGYWAIGGYVPKTIAVGGNMAQKAFDYLDLQRKDDKSFTSFFSNHYRFDSKVLKKSGIRKKELPANSDFVNQEPSFIQQHKWPITVISIVIILLIAGFLTTFYYYIRMRTLKNHLEASEHQLRQEKSSLEDSEKALRTAKEQAEEINKMKTAFIANMSHEIRTPLNSIVGFANILVSSVQDNPEISEYAKIISHNSDLLLRLVNEVLDISHLESGTEPFNYESHNIIPYIESVLRSVEHGKHEGVEFRFKPDKEELYIETDIMRFQQLLTNLLSNAKKFTVEGFVELSYSLDRPNHKILFSVTDTGCGIPEDKRETIFERFVKLNDYIQGTGLGLSLCKLIVEKWGGEIWIDPSYKEGTRFVFSHPLRQKKA